jgi:hypothetical protein
MIRRTFFKLSKSALRSLILEQAYIHAPDISYSSRFSFGFLVKEKPVMAKYIKII